jgi:hypothetical protein
MFPSMSRLNPLCIFAAAALAGFAEGSDAKFGTLSLATLLPVGPRIVLRISLVQTEHQVQGTLGGHIVCGVSRREHV